MAINPTAVKAMATEALPLLLWHTATMGRV